MESVGSVGSVGSLGSLGSVGSVGSLTGGNWGGKDNVANGKKWLRIT